MSKMQILSYKLILYKMAILFAHSPICKCTSKQGCATESFNFTISCQVSHKFPPETQLRKYALNKKKSNLERLGVVKNNNYSLWHHRSAMHTESFVIDTIGLQCVQRALL